jgi:hypothetical protein
LPLRKGFEHDNEHDFFQSPSTRRYPVALGLSERAEDEETCCDANTGVCHIERWPGIFVDVEMEKVGHCTPKNSVGQISKNTAGEQAEGYLCQVTQTLSRLSAGRIPDQQESDYTQRCHRQSDEKEIISCEHAERGTGIRSVNQTEKPRNNRDLCAIRDILAYEPLRELVQGEERQS